MPLRANCPPRLAGRQRATRTISSLRSSNSYLSIDRGGDGGGPPFDKVGAGDQGGPERAEGRRAAAGDDEVVDLGDDR
jgi:hypothetical protein